MSDEESSSVEYDNCTFCRELRISGDMYDFKCHNTYCNRKLHICEMCLSYGELLLYEVKAFNLKCMMCKITKKYRKYRNI